MTEGFQLLNDNLTVCFLLGHRVNPFPEPYPGSGVAMRQTIIYRRLTVTVNYSFFIFHFSFFIQAQSAAFCKAAGCGEAAHFPCHKHGKYKTAGFVSRRPTDR